MNYAKLMSIGSYLKSPTSGAIMIEHLRRWMRVARIFYDGVYGATAAVTGDVKCIVEEADEIGLLPLIQAVSQRM